jgi:hypothetical protein
MPTFPSSPLRFRTVGFPQYGSKAGRSRGVFLLGASGADAVGFRASHSPGRAVSLRTVSEPATCASTAMPQGPSLRSGLCCPGPSLLAGPIRPTRRHSGTSSPCDLYPLPSLCPPGLSDLRVVPCFRCCSFSACRPLRPRGIHRLHTPSSFADDTGLHRASNCSALPTPPPSASGGTSFSRLNRFARATACRVACLPGGSDRSMLQPTETFTLGLSTSRSPFSSPSITTVAAGQLPPAGLPPTGSAASIRCTEAQEER